MVISEDSQLGLRFKRNEVKVAALELMAEKLEAMSKNMKDVLPIAKARLDYLESEIKIAKENGNAHEVNEGVVNNELNKFLLPDNWIQEGNNAGVRGEIGSFASIDDMYNNDDCKYFLVCESVYKAAELINISENFTGRTLKDIKLGSYVYLMGKNRMIKFIVVDRGIKGIYYNDMDNVTFEWGIEMNSGKYFCNNGFDKEFSMIMQLLTFIELGDIEVKYLNPLQKIRAEKKQDSTYNASLNTVYVVDSTWNQILIRTDGFAVRGHFKLQPCGPGLIDRKLIWINAYEKDGYTRKPKASIVK